MQELGHGETIASCNILTIQKSIQTWPNFHQQMLNYTKKVVLSKRTHTKHIYVPSKLRTESSVVADFRNLVSSSIIKARMPLGNMATMSASIATTRECLWSTSGRWLMRGRGMRGCIYRPGILEYAHGLAGWQDCMAMACTLSLSINIYQTISSYI